MKTYTRTEKNIEIVRTCVDFRRRTSGLSKQGEYDISKYGKCGGSCVVNLTQQTDIAKVICGLIRMKVGIAYTTPGVYF